MSFAKSKQIFARAWSFLAWCCCARTMTASRIFSASMSMSSWAPGPTGVASSSASFVVMRRRLSLLELVQVTWPCGCLSLRLGEHVVHLAPALVDRTDPTIERLARALELLLRLPLGDVDRGLDGSGDQFGEKAHRTDPPTTKP